MEFTLPGGLTAELARRRCRLRLYIWHRLRHSWLRLTPEGQSAVEKISPLWVPPRPALDRRGNPLPDNGSGEDFLYANRRMLKSVNRTLSTTEGGGPARIDSWRRVPPPGDPDYPVPNFPDSGLEALKSDDYYRRYLATWESRYTDEGYLRGVTLGRLGSEIEFTIGKGMQLRWAAPSTVGYRPTTSIARDIDRQWDAPAYDYLGDVYASHVNPLFWKMRGWVDDRVEDWRRAHAVIGDIEWEGTWEGPPVGEDDAGAVDIIERIDRAISDSGGDVVEGFLMPTRNRF